MARLGSARLALLRDNRSLPSLDVHTQTYPRTHDAPVGHVLGRVHLGGLVPAQRMGAAGVGPHVREGDLGAGALLEEEAALRVEEEDAEGPVQDAAGLWWLRVEREGQVRSDQVRDGRRQRGTTG